MRKIAQSLSAVRPQADIAEVDDNPPVYIPGLSGMGSSVKAGSSPKFRGGQFEPNDRSVVTVIGGALSERVGGYSFGTVMIDTATGARLGALGDGIAIETDSPAFDLCMDTRGKEVCLYVTDLETGRRARASTRDQATSEGFFYHKWRWTSARRRRLELFVPTTVVLRSLNVMAGYGCKPAAFPSEPRIALLWDSWGGKASLDASAEHYRTKLGIPDWIGAALGSSNVTNLSLGSTGFIASKGGYGSYLDRIALGGDLSEYYIGEMQVVLIPGSLNDNRYSHNDLRRAAAQTYRAAMAQQPQALIYGMGPQSRRGQPISQSRHDAVRDGFLAARAGDTRCRWLDISPEGSDLYGELFKAPTSIFGNDPDHPNLSGMKVVGLAIGQLIRADLERLAEA